MNSQAIDLIEKNISTWHEKDRLDCLLLLGLLGISKNQPNIAKEGIAAWDLVDAVTKVRNRQWSTADDKKSMADDVRMQWKKMEKLWLSKSEGIRQSLMDAGLKNIPNFQRMEGGGTGRPTKYQVQWTVLDDHETVVDYIDQSLNKQNSMNSLRYIPEDIKDPGFYGKIFVKGYLLNGWRRRLYQTVIIIFILMISLLSLLVVLNLVFFNTSKANQLGALAINILLILLIFFSIFPLLNLTSKGILLAPWWMQSLENESLLEFRKPPRFKDKSIIAVSYTASCPICSAKVIAKSGGLEFFGRIIGRCEDAPVEHIFSFDHITRQGSWLRK